MIQAVLFDFDGTIGDTIPVCLAAFHQSMEPILNRKLTDEEILATFGPSEEGTVAVLLEQYGKTAFDGAGRETEDYRRGFEGYLYWYEQFHKTLAPKPFDGIDELLSGLRRAGIRIGLVTGKGPKTCEISLRQYGMNGVFEQIETGTSAGLRKADGIRRILDQFGIAPYQARYVGDMPSDITGAREAGLETFAVAWATSADRRRLAAANPLALCDNVDQLRTMLLNQPQ